MGPGRHIPNLLSGLRLACALPLGWALLEGHHDIALVLLAAAGVTDLLDGFLAKRMGWQSALGAWLDPAADKLVALVVLLALFATGHVPAWFAAIAITRDLVIAGGSLAFHWMVRTLRPQPTVLGRSAVFAQVLYLGFVLLDLAFMPVADRSLWWMAHIAAALTLASGADYVVRFAQEARAVARSGQPPR